MGKTGGNDGGSLGWLIFKLILMGVGAIVLIGFLMSIFKYIVVVALIGGGGYLGYRLLTNKKAPALSVDADPLLLEAEASLDRELRLLEEHDRIRS